VLNGGGVTEHEYWEHGRCYNLAAWPIRDDDGRVASLVHVIRDITERKGAEAALRESEAKYRIVADNTYDWEFWIDEDERLLYCSPSCVRITGHRAEEFLADPTFYARVVHPDDRAIYEAHRRTSKTSPDASSAEFRVVRPDGSVRWVGHVCVPVHDESGVAIGRRGSNRDVTERKHAEEEKAKLQADLLQSQKIESIGRLAGGVAHDFNNILTVILGYVNFALRDVREGDPLRDALAEIQTAGERAAALTRQLLAFSRKQVLQPVSLNLNRVAADLEKMLRRLIGEDVDLVLAPAPDLGRVTADPGQIEQVLINLAVNARDAMPDGGKLTIETANVEIDAEYAAHHVAVKPGPYVLLAVSDTGHGMDEATRARVFEPFFTTKQVGKGTGLGLSTVYGIVKQSGGNVWVYSEPGKGTSFKIYLPRDASDAAPTVRDAAPAARVEGTETLLIVEDEESLRGLATRILARLGYTVLTAANGGEALLLCEQHAKEIHLVLTDVVMPMMGGRVLVERLRGVRPGIKVLYMSGYTDNAIVHHGVLDADVKFIGKPFRADDLATKVREVLDGPRR
jgi:PAS domain S-box-containing protein